MAQINTSNIAKSSLWLISGFGLKKVFQLTSQIILVRLLSPEDFGIWGMIIIMTQLAEIFNDSTIAGVLIQRGLEDRKLANGVYSIGVNLSILIFIFQVISGYFAAHFFREPIVFPLASFTALVFLISAGSGSHVAVLQRQMKFRELSIIDALSSFVRFGGSIILAALGLGVWAFAISEVASTLIKSFLKYWFSRYPFQYSFILDPCVTNDVRGFISSLVSINLAVYINTTSDNILTGRFLGARELGFYSIAYQLAMIPLYALSQINRVNFSVISQKDKDGQLRYIGKSLQLCAITSAPIYAVSYIVAPWVIPLVYGPEWQPVVALFQIILVFAYARGFMSILGTALNSLNYPQVNAWINWILVPISIPTFFIGLHLGDLQGLAIAVVIVMGIVATIWFWIATCWVAQWNIWSIAKPVILPTLAAIVSILITMLIPFPNYNYIEIFLKAFIVISIYLFLIFIGSGGESMKILVQTVKKIIK